LKVVLVVLVGSSFCGTVKLLLLAVGLALEVVDLLLAELVKLLLVKVATVRDDFTIE
jgi:hypothetical protein